MTCRLAVHFLFIDYAVGLPYSLSPLSNGCGPTLINANIPVYFPLKIKLFV